MAQFQRFFIFIALLFSSLSSIADLPPPVNAYEECANKQLGDSCTYNWGDAGMCQWAGSKLKCGRPPSDRRGKNEAAVNIKNNEAALEPTYIKEEGDNSSVAQGCTNMASLQTSFVSLLSVFSGLLLLVKIRKKD